MYKMPFRDNSFDIILGGRDLMDSFIYEHNFPELYLELARMIKPGGIFVPGLDIIKQRDIIQYQKDRDVVERYFNILEDDKVRWFILERNTVEIQRV